MKMTSKTVHFFWKRQRPYENDIQSNENLLEIRRPHENDTPNHELFWKMHRPHENDFQNHAK